MKAQRKRADGGGMEENTMAILDTSCFTKSTQHLSDDRLSFLEAVRSASIGTAPTKKMYEAIFKILIDENSLDLIMGSYQFLSELDKRFPRVYLSKDEKSESCSPSTSKLELVVVEEAWTPFIFVPDVSSSDKQEADSKVVGSIDANGFHLLIQDVAKVGDEANSEALELKLLRNMLLLQYLANVIEGDFLPRNSCFKETMNWILLRESLLSILLGSRRIIYKNLIKDCLAVLCKMSQFFTDSSDEVQKNCDTPVTLALPELTKFTCTAIQKLLLMITELDSSTKIASMQGLTTRADGVRIPAVEIVLDEFTYDRESLSPFLQAIAEPKWKLDMIVLYLLKYIPKSSARTRRSSGPVDDATFDGVLKSFSNNNSAKSIVKKVSSEIAQLLLGHAFQAYISISFQHSSIPGSKENVNGSSVTETCKNLISAFNSLKRADEQTEILPFGKEALFTAATILSRSS